MVVIRDVLSPVMVGRKVLEDTRISNAAVGFYCRLMANKSWQKNDASEFEPNEEEKKCLQELLEHGYAEKVDEIYLINSGL